MPPDAVCTNCDVPIDPGARECTECGNNPKHALRMYSVAAFVVALALGTLSWLIWPLIFVTPILALISVGLFVLSFIVSPAKHTETKTYRLF